MTVLTTGEIPRDLVRSIAQGRCILFLGAMASAPTPAGAAYNYTKSPPSGTLLSKVLALDCGYPENDWWNLPRVALFYESSEGFGRESLVSRIEELVTAGVEIGNSGTVRLLGGTEVSPAMMMLARLPFRFIITTNYDDLFERALRASRTGGNICKEPLVEIYNPGIDAIPRKVPLDPKEERPVLFKLHGSFSDRKSLVVTEEDYLHFVQKMASDKSHPMHQNLRARIADWHILFIGYSLKDYNLRLLFRTLDWWVDEADCRAPFQSIAIQIGS
jgi:hypothetical protein